MASALLLMRWFGVMSPSRASHHAVSCVRTAPLCGIGCGSTTSNALIRSVATMRSRSSPTA
jgi:ribose 5-phosphate isomerase